MINKTLLISVIFFTGCSLSGEVQVIKKEAATITNKAFTVQGPLFFAEGTLDIIIIDGCEYLYGHIGGSGGYVLCHKGNCNNPIHIYNKEKE